MADNNKVEEKQVENASVEQEGALAEVAELYYEDEKKIKRKKALRMAGLYAMISFFALFIIIPFYWMIITALKTTAQVETSPPLLLIKPA